jgi:hypothetical protein
MFLHELGDILYVERSLADEASITASASCARSTRCVR